MLQRLAEEREQAAHVVVFLDNQNKIQLQNLSNLPIANISYDLGDSFDDGSAGGDSSGSWGSYPVIPPCSQATLGDGLPPQSAHRYTSFTTSVHFKDSRGFSWVRDLNGGDPVRESSKSAGVGQSWQAPLSEVRPLDKC